MAAAEARVRERAATLVQEGEPIVYLGALLFPSDEVVFFEFGAASIDAVRRVSELAALPLERVVESVGGQRRAVIQAEGPAT